MNYVIHDHLLAAARQVTSPHQNERPQGTLINLLVIHGISLPPGQFGARHIEDFFAGKLKTDSHPYYATICDLKVSAHLLITRHGDMVQFVPFDRRAWHAGESVFDGRSGCNDFSIGIELEGSDNIPYTSIQYQQLADVVRALQTVYPAITHDRIVGHSDVAPRRKTDPGMAFDWNHLRQLLQGSQP